jgi:hypothetical protein
MHTTQKHYSPLKYALLTLAETLITFETCIALYSETLLTFEICITN